jgi:8-oxo-dGTP pyrophosphatase MutT (NUDIX family)
MYIEKPKDFSMERQGAVCLVESNGDFLFLKRAPHCHSGGLWSIAPGGKLEKGEIPLQGMLREVAEETQISLLPDQLKFLKILYYRFPDMEYALHYFYAHFSSKPTIHLSHEHTEFCWYPLSSALQLPLMRNSSESIHYFLTHLKIINSDSQ